MNDTYIVTAYVIIDDVLKLMNHHDDSRARTSAAEILTIAVVAAKYFQNHHERTVCILRQLGYITSVSVSRFNRRFHQLLAPLSRLLEVLSALFRTGEVFVIDSMPLPVCKPVRAQRSTTIRGKRYRGRCHLKRETFYGFRLHLVCTSAGLPVAFDILPASWHDLVPVQHLTAELPPRAKVVADRGYVSDYDGNLCYLYGDIDFIPLQRRNMIPNSDHYRALIRQHRPMIETVYSQLEKMGVQRLHNRTLIGRFLKVYASLLALLCNAFV